MYLSLGIFRQHTLETRKKRKSILGNLLFLIILIILIAPVCNGQWTNTTEPDNVFIASVGLTYWAFVDDNHDLFVLGVLNNKLYLHKFNKLGYKLWSTTVVENPLADIYWASEYSSYTAMTETDENGGAFVIWVDHRNSTIVIENGYPHIINNAIRIQRVIKDGTLAWNKEGIIIADETSHLKRFAGGNLYPDGKNGVFVNWVINQDNLEPYPTQVVLQRVGPDGSFLLVQTGSTLEEIDHTQDSTTAYQDGVVIGVDADKELLHATFDFIDSKWHRKYKTFGFDGKLYSEFVTESPIGFNYCGGAIWTTQKIKASSTDSLKTDSLRIGLLDKFPTSIWDTTIAQPKNHRLGAARHEMDDKNFYLVDENGEFYKFGFNGRIEKFSFALSFHPRSQFFIAFKKGYLALSDDFTNGMRFDEVFHPDPKNTITVFNPDKAYKIGGKFLITDKEGGVYIIFLNGFIRVQHITAQGTIGIATQIESIVKNTKDFKVFQNYPNPFGTATLSGNPVTNITFSIPSNSHVKITLLDALGREVRTITEYEYSAGVHSVSFDASSLTSGVYFYKMIAEKFSLVKKMTVIK